MDIVGGKGICMGPRNMIADAYTMTPVSITVEGANILTRSLIIFGQGAIRCHPYVLEEMDSLKLPFASGLKKFDKLIFAHLGLTISNAVRSLALGISNSALSLAPKCKSKQERKIYKQVARLSASFAFISDLSMIVLGSNLKRRESLSAKLGDVLSYLYMLTACLKYFSNSEHPAEEEIIFKWVTSKIIVDTENTLSSIINNLPIKPIRSLVRFICLPLGKRARVPSDSSLAKITELFINPSLTSKRLLENICVSADKLNPLGYAVQNLPAIIRAEEYEYKLHKAVKTGQVAGLTLEEQLKSARAIGLLTEQQEEMIIEADRIRQEVGAVDDFSDAELQTNGAKAVIQESGDING